MRIKVDQQRMETQTKVEVFLQTKLIRKYRRYRDVQDNEITGTDD